MAANLSTPVDVQIELTQSCNWHCRHCYNYWRSPISAAIESHHHLSQNDILHIAQELIRNQVPSITITGGEPFLRRNELFALLAAVKKAGIHASINTNLSLVREEDIERIADEYCDVSILFSLLSADATEHERLARSPAGSHAKAISAAKLAIERGLKVSLNMVLVRENLHAMESTARFAEGLGVSTFCATKALPNVHTHDYAFLLSTDDVHWSLAELMRIEKSFDISVDILGCYPRCLLIGTPAYRRFSHRTCVAGYTTVTIGTDGNVRPCSHMKTSYGNIFNDTLAEIWQKMNGWREGRFIPKQCRSCPIVTGCRGGCRVNTLAPSLQNIDRYADPQRLNNFLQDYLTDPRVSEETGDMPDEVIVCPGVKFRDESFGALLYLTNPLTIVLVNQSTAVFLKDAAKESKRFDFRVFLEQSGAETDRERRGVKHLYRKLTYKGFLVSPTSHERR